MSAAISNAGRLWDVGSPEHVELWDAIHAYADARTPSCVGNPAMERSVVRVEGAMSALIRAAIAKAKGEAP